MVNATIQAEPRSGLGLNELLGAARESLSCGFNGANSSFKLSLVKSKLKRQIVDVVRVFSELAAYLDMSSAIYREFKVQV